MFTGAASFSWLAFCVSEIMNKFKVGSDGRTAYARITGHKCRHIAIIFAECTLWWRATGNQHKADSKLMDGILLEYMWMTIGYATYKMHHHPPEGRREVL